MLENYLFPMQNSGNEGYHLVQLFKKSNLVKKYEIFQKEILGKGGFSYVFSGKEIKTKKECAIKIMNLNQDSLSPDNLSESKIEIEICKKLKNPHIIRIEDDNIDEKSKSKGVIIVMEKAFKSLQHLIQEKPSGLSKGILLQMILDVTTGLHYAHEKENTSHLDLKPLNILFLNNVDRDKLKGQQTFV